MAKRKNNTSGIEALLVIASKLPWYVGLLLAVFFYLILSHLAVQPEPQKNNGVASISVIVLSQFIHIFASIGQYVLPFIFILGSISSLYKKFKAGKEFRSSSNPVWKSPAGSVNNTASSIDAPVSNQADMVMPTNWSIDLIKKIEWRIFEKLAIEYFVAKGYKVLETDMGKDGGVDFYLYKSSVDETQQQQQQPLSAVQCKSWLTRKVDVKTVRELYGVMAAENITLGAVIASGEFTDDAIAFSKGKHIQLIDGEKLLSLILDLPESAQSKLLATITAGDYTTPTCPSCDIKLVKRTASKGRNKGSSFWGCRHFPKCRYTLKNYLV